MVPVCVFLLYASSFHMGGLLMAINAEPTVSATILTPQADRKEGGQVHMNCIANDLQPNHTVEWTSEDPFTSLRIGEDTPPGTDLRFMFETGTSGIGMITQNLTITDLQRGDAGDYVCNVREPLLGGGTKILASSRITLSVIYFPNDSFPVCYPNGSLTADAGTELSMRCSSESGNPPVSMVVSSEANSSAINRWKMKDVGDMISRSMNLTLEAADDGVRFQCSISSTSFDGMTRSCTIGPITVREANDPGLHSSAIASAVAGGGLLIVAVFAICICICNQQQRCLQGSATRTETHMSTLDPYSETVKSTAEVSREYSQPAARGAAAKYTKRDDEANVGDLKSIANEKENHVYHQAVGDNEGSDHDDEIPDPKCEYILEPETVTTKL